MLICHQHIMSKLTDVYALSIQCLLGIVQLLTKLQRWSCTATVLTCILLHHAGSRSLIQIPSYPAVEIHHMNRTLSSDCPQPFTQCPADCGVWVFRNVLSPSQPHSHNPFILLNAFSQGSWKYTSLSRLTANINMEDNITAMVRCQLSVYCIANDIMCRW